METNSQHEIMDLPLAKVKHRLVDLDLNFHALHPRHRMSNMGLGGYWKCWNCLANGSEYEPNGVLYTCEEGACTFSLCKNCWPLLLDAEQKARVKVANAPDEVITFTPEITSYPKCRVPLVSFVSSVTDLWIDPGTGPKSPTQIFVFKLCQNSLTKLYWTQPWAIEKKLNCTAEYISSVLEKYQPNDVYWLSIPGILNHPLRRPNMIEESWKELFRRFHRCGFDSASCRKLLGLIDSTTTPVAGLDLQKMPIESKKKVRPGPYTRLQKRRDDNNPNVRLQRQLDGSKKK